MKIGLASVFVDDQEKALKFYTEVLGFVKKVDLPAGQYRFITVISPEGSDGIQLLLEPNDNPAAKAYQQAIFASGLQATTFFSDDVERDYNRLKDLGVVFTAPPAANPFGMSVTFQDTCGNLIGIQQT
jgi:predicted enzyme related to lactoylglutathione lyase